MEKSNQKVISPFLQQLYKMVQDPEIYHIISWNSAGDAIVIKDEDLFVTQIRKNIFESTKFSSF